MSFPPEHLNKPRGRPIMRGGLATDREAVTTDTAVQEFWLQNLSKADAFTRWVVDEMSPWLGRSILEVGCGIGTYTAEIALSARQVVAMDLERTFIEQAARRLGERPNVQLICGDATQADLPELRDRAF